jgi:serine/threonine protein kinase
MTTATGRSPEARLTAVAQDDPRVVEALEEYIRLLEEGLRPDRNAFLEGHADVAPALEKCLGGLEFVYGTAARLSQLDEASLAGTEHGVVEPLAALGDFRIVREVGRGGMGIVYEAEQLSLGRKVALKVLPFAATLDPRQLHRFQNEARAAASLEQPHIVPVYGVGCERGVNFYAMKFIEGESLADLIEQQQANSASGVREPDDAPHRGAHSSRSLDSPGRATAGWMERVARDAAAFRQIAEWGIQAAEALEHAHRVGIVHRDIKPANLIIDGQDSLWVTDFGLARTATNEGLTMSGDVLGTLRYMSPEQALAKRALVDHRSDVYALGVTLYEALTLQPAYAGSDREELLRQIAAGEPRPPRRLEPSIPVELETIVLKAMAREPEGRYQTAQEMADDLRRFLEGQPILARRPSLSERAVRWSQRHRTALGATLAVLLLSFAGLLTALVFLWNEQARTKAALAEAEKQQRRAEVNFSRALSGATEMLAQLDAPSGNSQHIDPALRQKLIDRGLRFHQGFIDEGNPDAGARFQSSRAYEQIARVHCSLHDAANCRAAMEKSCALLERLIADFPRGDLYRRELIRERYLMGLFYKSLGHKREAREQYLRTMELCRLTAELEVSAETMNTCGWILVDCPDETLRDPDLAVALAEKAVTADSEQAKYWNTLGVAYYRKGDWTKARASLEQSMNQSNGGSPYDWIFLAMACQRLGDVEGARVWRAKAVSWLEMQEGKSEDMLRYRAEADALHRP